MALQGQGEPARFGPRHKEDKILCGRVAIGASGAVTDVATPGVIVVRVSEGLYRFTITAASGGVNAFMYTSVNLMLADELPATAALAISAKVSSVVASTGIVEALTFRYKNNSTPAELLEQELQDPQVGAFLEYMFVVHDSGMTIP